MPVTQQDNDGFYTWLGKVMCNPEMLREVYETTLQKSKEEKPKYRYRGVVTHPDGTKEYTGDCESPSQACDWAYLMTGADIKNISYEEVII